MQHSHILKKTWRTFILSIRDHARWRRHFIYLKVLWTLISFLDVKNIDNSLKKSNIKLHRVKEGLAGSYMTGYLIDLLTSCASSESDLDIIINATNRIGLFWSSQKYSHEYTPTMNHILKFICYWLLLVSFYEATNSLSLAFLQSQLPQDGWGVNH